MAKSEAREGEITKASAGKAPKGKLDPAEVAKAREIAEAKLANRARLYVRGQLVDTIDVKGAPASVRHDGQTFERRQPGIYTLVQPGPVQTRHG